MGASEGDGEVDRRGKARRFHRESPREMQRERQAQQRAVRDADLAHQRERFAIGAEQQVLAVVEKRAAVFDPSRAPAGRAARLEDAHRVARAHQANRGGEARIARADDRHAPRHGPVPGSRLVRLRFTP